jgi:hypothetical protein
MTLWEHCGTVVLTPPARILDMWAIRGLCTHDAFLDVSYDHRPLDEGADIDLIDQRNSALETAVELNAVLLPAHFSAPHAFRVSDTGSGFAVTDALRGTQNRTCNEARTRTRRALRPNRHYRGPSGLCLVSGFRLEGQLRLLVWRRGR